MTRSGTAVFVDGNDNDKDRRKSFCRLCEERTGRLYSLVPRLLEGNIEDDHFKQCPYCAELYPKYEIMYEPIFEPKGYISDNPHNSSALRISAARTKRIMKANKIEGIEPVEVEKLAGKPDIELEDMLSGKDRPAILLRLDTAFDELGDY